MDIKAYYQIPTVHQIDSKDPAKVTEAVASWKQEIHTQTTNVDLALDKATDKENEIVDDLDTLNDELVELKTKIAAKEIDLRQHRVKTIDPLKTRREQLFREREKCVRIGQDFNTLQLVNANKRCGATDPGAAVEQLKAASGYYSIGDLDHSKAGSRTKKASTVVAATHFGVPASEAWKAMIGNPAEPGLLQLFGAEPDTINVNNEMTEDQLDEILKRMLNLTATTVTTPEDEKKRRREYFLETGDEPPTKKQRRSSMGGGRRRSSMGGGGRRRSSAAPTPEQLRNALEVVLAPVLAAYDTGDTGDTGDEDRIEG